MTGVREWLQTAREERWGMLTDLVFAIVWVTLVEMIFYVAGGGPTWAYYGCMLAGVVAYFGLIWNFNIAVNQQNQ